MPEQKSKKSLDSLRQSEKAPPEPFAALSRQARVVMEKTLTFTQETVSVYGRRDLWPFLGLALLVLVFFGGASLSGPGEKLQKQVLGSTTTGFEYLNQGGQNLAGQDLTTAGENFRLAYESFQQAEAQIQSAGGALSMLVELLPRGGDVNKMLEAGRLTSQALSDFSEGLKHFNDTKLRWDPEANSSGQELFQSTRASREFFVRAKDQLGSALNLLAQVNLNSLPEGYQGQFETSAKKLVRAERSLHSLVTFQDIVVSLLGGESKEYLLLFQNNNELRATGGFIGTYGILQFENGSAKLQKIETIYNLDGQLREKVAPPAPLTRMLTDEWGLRDSNWFVDFPKSARKALLFYESSTGRLADGVIALTPDVFVELLALLGPVEMAEHGEVLSAENFREVSQYKTSIDYDREQNTPKKFLADFAPALLTRLSSLDQDRWPQVLDVLTSNVQEKQILAFSLDENLQAKFEALGVAGRIHQTEGDYLAVFHTNVGGGKTNQSIAEQISKKVFVDEAGRASVELRVTRTHQDTREEFFPKNIDFMRILVPAGSRLISAAGFDPYPLERLVSQKTGAVDPDVAFWEERLMAVPGSTVYAGSEAGYTEFAGWQELSPGEQKTVTLTYYLPFQLDRTYTQLLQKQPGLPDFQFSLEVSLPGKVVFSYPSKLWVENGQAKITEVIAHDKFHAVITE